MGWMREHSHCAGASCVWVMTMLTMSNWGGLGGDEVVDVYGGVEGVDIDDGVVGVGKHGEGRLTQRTCTNAYLLHLKHPGLIGRGHFVSG